MGVMLQNKVALFYGPRRNMLHTNEHSVLRYETILGTLKTGD